MAEVLVRAVALSLLLVLVLLAFPELESIIPARALLVLYSLAFALILFLPQYTLRFAILLALACIAGQLTVWDLLVSPVRRLTGRR